MNIDWINIYAEDEKLPYPLLNKDESFTLETETMPEARGKVLKGIVCWSDLENEHKELEIVLPV